MTRRINSEAGGSAAAAATGATAATGAVAAASGPRRAQGRGSGRGRSRALVWLRQVPTYTFLVVFSAFSVFPLYFMVVSATNTSADVLASRLLPGSNLAQNWAELTATQDVASAFWYSAVIAIVNTVLALVICSIAGYGFEIFHSKGKDRLMAVLLLAMMIPFAATMIPLFQMFGSVGLINSVPAVVLPTVSTPFLILLFRQASRNFPHEILEAARIDGLSEIAIFIRIYMPTMRSTYAAAAVITFMNAWNNFLWPKVILIDNAYQTMPMLISNLSAGYVTNYGVLMLAVLITSLPAMVVFFTLQRAFSNGMVGAIK